MRFCFPLPPRMSYHPAGIFVSLTDLRPLCYNRIIGSTGIRKRKGQIELMDISIIISLVGSGSALLGTLIGGVLSHQTISRQIRTENARLLRSEKVTVYTNFLAAYTAYVDNAHKFRMTDVHNASEEMSALHHFLSASSAAVLLAPSPVGRELKTLANMASRYAEGQIDAQKIGEKYNTVEALLRKDLEQPGIFER